MASRPEPAPYREVVRVTYSCPDIFGQDSVILECGHKARCSPGARRTRCKKCRAEAARDSSLRAATDGEV